MYLAAKDMGYSWVEFHADGAFKQGAGREVEMGTYIVKGLTVRFNPAKDAETRATMVFSKADPAKGDTVEFKSKFLSMKAEITKVEDVSKTPNLAAAASPKTKEALGTHSSTRSIRPCS